VVLDALPRLASGKLDRRSLPAPERVSHAQIAPRTDAEIQLATIWQDVLGIDQVGITDNFFALGGHSLLAMKLAARIRDGFGVDVSVPRIFEAADLAELATEIAALQSGGPDLQRELATALDE